MVRRATLDDLAAINRIENWAVAHTVAHFGLDPIPLDETRAHFERTQATYPWFVADEDAAVVGFCRTGPWKERAAYRWTVEIGVYVDPEWQSRGIGKELYGALLPAIRALGFKSVFAGITMPNDASVRLHESVGMVKCAHFPKAGFKNGSWWDTAYWALHWED